MANQPSGQILARLTENLAEMSETPVLDASVLLASVLDRPRAWVLAHPEATLTPVQEQNLGEAVARLRSGEPLPYVLGSWEFFGLRFKVTPASLIPRPETELLIERALVWLKAHPDKRRALDIGTGTGCIATALAVNCPDLNCTAVDISSPGLALARENTAHHQVQSRVPLVQAQLLTPFAPACCDLLCANLPYIPSAELGTLRVSRFEPTVALDGGEDGLVLIRALLKQAVTVLAHGALALLEIEERQGHAVQALAEEILPGARVAVQADLAGKDRLLVAELPPL